MPGIACYKGANSRKYKTMPISKFTDILGLAERHHGAAGVKARLGELSGTIRADLNQSDDRFLAGMTKAVFSSGFSWSVVEQKWPGFEAAFEGFDPHRVAFYADDDITRLLKDTRIIRNGAKIAATVANARFIVNTATKHGSFGAFLRAWPPSDQVGLVDHFRKNAQRLGGSSAMYFLRFSGWDAFVLSPDVTKALIRESVVDTVPTSKAQMRAVQEAFNAWTRESKRPQREVSRILALSVGPS